MYVADTHQSTISILTPRASSCSGLKSLRPAYVLSDPLNDAKKGRVPGRITGCSSAAYSCLAHAWKCACMNTA